jgi:hypothetical protein
MKNWVSILENLTLWNKTIKESKVLLNLPQELHKDWYNFMIFGYEL